ncbi:MAG: ATP-binding cassette domain-containing protein [Alphaproteobacteria bacterium]|nr:ATP-binding cassette domain-containing protein [Alphaproteobacteria bacterium]
MQTELKARCGPRQTAFLGPFAETCLSGFAVTPQDEMLLYGQSAPTGPWADLFTRKRYQPISTLSGGEQVMLALTVLSGRKDVQGAAVDCALEQLDPDNSRLGLDVLDHQVRDIIYLVDHRLRPEDLAASEMRTPQPPSQRRYAFGPSAAGGENIPLFPNLPWRLKDHRHDSERSAASAGNIELRDLDYAYDNAEPVFRKYSLRLEPGRVYRLQGPNGSGKSTLFKLLCGILRPLSGAMLVDGEDYHPFTNGNALVAYAMQNPDEQWVATSLSADLSLRLTRQGRALAEGEGALWAQYFRMFDVDLDRPMHVLDFPRALRKRLSWYWALSGVMPWSVLDEPTLGQDDATVSALAERIRELTAVGRGVVIVTHDKRLIDALQPVTLRLGICHALSSKRSTMPPPMK